MPYPSMRTLADKAGISERQVQRSINSLEKKGYFKKDRKKIKGVIATNSYDLTPLVEMLKIVAEHYVNKYPRNIKVPENESTKKKV